MASSAFAPVPTPVHRDRSLDPAALARHLHWLADRGLNGALILGTNGEFPSFSVGERTIIARAAAAAGADLRLMLNVGSCNLDDVEHLLDVAGECGYESVLCPPPFYFAAAPVRGLAAFFARVLDRAPVPVLLYHIPQVTGVPIADELLDAIDDHPNLAGVKDSTGSPAELARLCARFAGGTYLVGSDHLVSECRQSGGAGSITAAANVAPRLVLDAPSSPEHQAALSALRSLMERFGLIASAKAILRDLGLGEYRSRPPMADLAPADEAQLLAEVEELLGGVGLRSRRGEGAA
jgi:dihydrodipicolinate synthase/N-acetylneuraminate lyase